MHDFLVLNKLFWSQLIHTCIDTLDCYAFTKQGDPRIMRRLFHGHCSCIYLVFYEVFNLSKKEMAFNVLKQASSSIDNVRKKHRVEWEDYCCNLTFDPIKDRMGAAWPKATGPSITHNAPPYQIRTKFVNYCVNLYSHILWWWKNLMNSLFNHSNNLA